jgi:hypothetical protein
MVAGPPGSAIFHGFEIDLPVHEALRRIHAGEAIPAKPPIERAVRRAPETRAGKA